MELREAALCRDPEREQFLVLIDWLRRHPFLGFYLRLAKDRTKYRFGITSSQVTPSKAGHLRAPLRGPLEILTMLAENRVTNSMRVAVWGAYLRSLRDAGLRETANCILDQNLRARLSLRTLNAALRSVGQSPIQSE